MSDRPQTMTLLPSLEAVDALAPAAVPAFLAQLAALQLRAAARLVPSDGAGTGDRLLSIDATAARACVSKSWLYRHHATLPFARRIGRKVLFSEIGLARWLVSRPR